MGDICIFGNQNLTILFRKLYYAFWILQEVVLIL